MVSQAVAFNMFLAFFAVLLTALSVTKSSLEGGQEFAMRISGIFPQAAGNSYPHSCYARKSTPGTWRLSAGLERCSWARR